MQSRFGIDAFRLARWNLGYVLAILLLAGPTLWWCVTLGRLTG